MIVSKRLKTIASYLPEGCRRAADIGTDHGYLPIYALQEGLAQSFLAMDVRKGPLSKAKKNITEAGLADQVELRLSDGFGAMAPGEAQCAVIAGMGGELMARILEEGRAVAESLERLILSPQTEPEKVRGWLSDHGFSVLEEELLTEEGQTYVIIEAAPGGGRSLREAELFYGPCLLQKADPLLLEQLLHQKDHLARLEEKLKGLSGGSEEALSRRFSAIDLERKRIEKALEMMGRN